MIANRVIGGNGGETASIFVTGLSETDTVYATKDGKTYNGRWTTQPNPELHGLPSGYTELEYIESTGTQYIDTGFTPNQDTRTVMKVTVSQSGSEQYLFGVRMPETALYDFHRYSNKWSIGYNSKYTDGMSYSGEMPFVIDFNKNNVYFNDVLVGSGTYGQFTCQYTAYLFDCNGKDYTPITATVYSCQIYDNGTLARNFVPAKRNSDGAIGLYDLVTNTFFGNNGTGSFVSGSEIPSTINAHLIDGLKEYGTYTVTATDGTNTSTQDVLVDVATQYDIEMSL